MATRSRLVIASNRLPFAVERSSGGLALRPTTGGLAAALGGVHQRRDNVWIGWPGDCSSLSASELEELDRRLRANRVTPVTLSRAELDEYYDGLCNTVLWPVLHYLPERLPVALPEFRTYRAVNERFAEAIVAQHRRGDMIWIHDYHLLLAPAMVRTRIPDAQIGFFLHTPFPAADVFRVLPWRRELLDGVLGATLVGLQTGGDASNFAGAISALTEYRIDGSTIVADRREIRFGAYPIGIDPSRLNSDRGVGPAGGVLEPRSASPGRKLLAAVDRLDYTKGIPRRLAAFERLLVENSHLRGQVELLQVAVPSREHLPPYVSLREEVDALVARINTRFETPGWTPVRYLRHAVSPAELLSIYRAADVMLVTSLRDGMNLVAKEFVWSREDEDGVLILSELAGASDELREAAVVNPYSVEQMAGAMAAALELEPGERRRRMRALRERVSARTVDVWVSRFTRDLEDGPDSGTSNEPLIATIAASVARGEEISLVLPYEGALVAASERSAEAAPDAELLELLRDLASSPAIDVHILSGFDHHTMDRWFDLVPAVLWAEHGLWRREREGHRWRQTQWLSMDWMVDVRHFLEQFTARTPGAFVEERSTALVWHFGRAERAMGQTQAQILAELLRDAAGGLGFMVRKSDCSIEVRPAGLSLGRTLQKVIDTHGQTRVVFLEEGRSSSEARDALRPSDLALSTKVSTGPGARPLPDARAVRSVLRGVIASVVPAKAAFPFHFRLPGRRRQDGTTGGAIPPAPAGASGRALRIER